MAISDLRQVATPAVLCELYSVTILNAIMNHFLRFAMADAISINRSSRLACRSSCA